MIRYLILVSILFTSCSVNDNKRLNDFNTQLGLEKSSTLDMITTSFETYLTERYPELNMHGFHDMFCCFLHDIAEHDSSLFKELTIPDSVALFIADRFEVSGLDKELFINVTDPAYIENHSSHVEILLADSSGYDIDSTVLSDYNLFGDYHVALSKVDNDEFIYRYVEARENHGDMSLPMLLPTFIYYCDKTDFNDPVIKRIITMEIFIQIVYSSLK